MDWGEKILFFGGFRPACLYYRHAGLFASLIGTFIWDGVGDVRVFWGINEGFWRGGILAWDLLYIVIENRCSLL